MKLRIQTRSIAFRLISAVLAVELISAVLVVALSYGYERHIHFQAFDVMLHGRADSVLGAVQDADDPGDNVLLDAADLHIPPDDVYEVWDAMGQVLGRSANWEGTSFSLPEKPWGDFFRLTIDRRHYQLLRILGSRTVDPGKPGGGKLRQVTIVYGSPTNHVWHAIRGAVEFYAVGSIVLLLVTGPLIAWLLHRGLLPLRQLASLAATVSVDAWHFSPPASAHTTPELAPLTHAIESVLERLERSFVQQKAFVSDAAHELKTAVAVQKSSLQLLSMKRRTAQEYEAGLERCLADCKRLESLVADMLALARAEGSAAAAEGGVCADLSACVREAVEQLEPVAALRGVGVDVPGPALDAVRVPMGQEDCTLLVSNLLLNALQHSPAGSTVAVRLRRDDGDGAPDAVLVIEDQGEGISPEALPHVFDRFYRGDPSRARMSGGTGLGLAIVKAMVQKAGGSIEIGSQPEAAQPGHGTKVTVRLPTAD